MIIFIILYLNIPFYIMPTKETLTNRRILHATQASSGSEELLCINCNTNKPRESFITSSGIRQKCTECSNNDKIANKKYRKEHSDKLLEKSKKYEEIRKENRNKRIEEHNRMVEEKCDTLICTRCNKHKPIVSFRGATSQITKHCYECRQYQLIIEASRSPDTRVRKPRIRTHDIKYLLCVKYCTYRRTDCNKGFCSEEEFNNLLPRHFAYNLMQTKCAYCDYLPPDSINGLDRVDNNKPHSFDNVLSCCETCNISKNDMPLREFVTYTQRISSVFKYIMTPTKRSFECPF